MKKVTFTAIVVLILVVILVAVGCGGSRSPAPSSETETNTSEQSKKESEEQLSSEEKIPRKIDFSQDSIPSEIKDALGKGKSVLISFFDPDDKSATEMEANLEQLEEKYENKLLFYSYTTDQMQEKQKDTGGQTSSAKEVSKLAEKVEVDFTPHLVIIDGSSNIVFEHSGYMDGTQIEQAAYNAVH